MLRTHEHTDTYFELDSFLVGHLKANLFLEYFVGEHDSSA